MIDTSPYPLDHVAIAVHSLDDALPVYELLSGGRGSEPETVAPQGVRVAFVRLGETSIELLEPTGPETAVGRFLARRGPGLHHIAFRVPDAARALRELIDAGFEPIDRKPRPGAGGHLVAFLHPRSAQGALVELVQHVAAGPTDQDATR